MPETNHIRKMTQSATPIHRWTKMSEFLSNGLMRQRHVVLPPPALSCSGLTRAIYAGGSYRANYDEEAFDLNQLLSIEGSVVANLPPGLQRRTIRMGYRQAKKTLKW